MCPVDTHTHTNKWSSKTLSCQQLVTTQIIHFNRLVKHLPSWWMSPIKPHLCNHRIPLWLHKDDKIWPFYWVDSLRKANMWLFLTNSARGSRKTAIRCRSSEDVLWDVTVSVWKYLRCETPVVVGWQKSEPCQRSAASQIFTYITVYAACHCLTVSSAASPLRLLFSLIGLSQRCTWVMVLNDTYIDVP